MRLISQAGEPRSAPVESVRALAALGVVVGHVFGTAHAYGPATTATYPRRVVFGGGLGVFVFFALSGYLLFWPFARRHWAGGETVDLGRYALNRVLRIVPLYYVVVVFLLLVQEHGGSGGQWLHFLTWTEAFSSHTLGAVDGVVWSLVVEVIFYATLPLLALALARAAGRSRARAAAILLGLAIASYLLYLALTSGSDAPALWRYAFPTNFMYFVPGMLVALLRTRWEERSPAAADGPLGASDAWLLASAALWLVVFADYQLIPLTGLACLLLVGGCVLPLRDGYLVRLLGWRPLAVIGIASYSLYLWHLPVIRLIAGTGVPSYGAGGLFVRVVPLACLVALVSYALIEAPFLRLRRRWSTPPARTGWPAPLEVAR